MSDTLDQRCTDPVARNLWHPIHSLAEMKPETCYDTLLLGVALSYTQDLDGKATAWIAQSPAQRLLVRLQYGYVWISLGDEPTELFEIPETAEADRRMLNAGSIKVATSAPRAVENFLDMGHFPFVHTGVLGIEPRTEVVEYNVSNAHDEILATECYFYQPKAAANASGGQISEYTYRVPHPYCVLLYKTPPTAPDRRDVIGLFVQPMTQETVRAHNFLCLVDETSSDTDLKRFQQMIFSQDKPILENQLPKRLPLDPRAEMPIRADKSSMMYRRWLRSIGLEYAVISGR